MSQKRTRRIATALAIAGVASLMTGCGAGSNSTPLLAAGLGTTGYLGTGTCVPISSTIPFTAQNAYMDSANIYAGIIPGTSQQIGQVVVGSGAPGPYMRNGQAVDGVLSMNITPASGYSTTGLYNPMGTYGVASGYPTDTVEITGTITIAPATQEDIMYQLGSLVGYTGTGIGTTLGITSPGIYGTGTTSLCVSGVALNAGHDNYQLYDATTYIYINGTQHGYTLAL
jgi:hypothetical protein